MEDILITVDLLDREFIAMEDLVKFVAKDLKKQLKKFPVIDKTNGFRGVFLHSISRKNVIYCIRYGQVREHSARIHKRNKYVI